MGRYPGSRSNRVGMSVEPWIEACPRSARMTPPGRPMLPSSACRIEAVRMYCTPTVRSVQPREDPIQVLGVGELLADDHRGVGVGGYVLAEVFLVLQDVVDDPAEEGDVGPGPQRHVQVGQCAGAGEPRVDVDHRGP